jgi:hypothetical protein
MNDEVGWASNWKIVVIIIIIIIIIMLRVYILELAWNVKTCMKARAFNRYMQLH